MTYTIKKIAVIGDGGWGTTLAVHLAKKNFPVHLWGPFPEYLRAMAKKRVNAKFLPGIRIPQNVKILEDLNEAIADCELIIFAIPSKYAFSIVKKMKATGINFSGRLLLSVTKGIDHAHLMRISQIIQGELKAKRICVLSGPTIAMEVAKGIPSTAVAASTDIKLAKAVQALINSNTFRIYSNTDIIGVELGGTVKNVIAIACGVCDGLGYGTNTKAAILTRGLAEMTRLGKALGARPQTFFGLSGLGDLVTTSFNEKSRNRSVGEKLGQGSSAKHITGRMAMVAEGVETVKGVVKLAQKHNVSMPITQEVYNIIYRHKKPAQAVGALMGRKTKSE
ncbi:MAG TPA: NAD(P)H-dependent glycerol-3-phosphate dehydrogenase [Candidatus Omnitrophota bacterium]|nr:NAD(P)H-dependent glycerol-3-phosphate dehydrogenase [Candidatus Omnitrophota bacterium]